MRAELFLPDGTSRVVGVDEWAAWCSAKGEGSLECYTDGACTRGPIEERSRAAWAVVAACPGPEGPLLGALSGPVWRGSAQTSGCAEWQAVGACVQAFGGSGTEVHLISDYLAAV